MDADSLIVVLPYLAVFVVLVWLMLPNAAAWSAPKINIIAAKRARHEEVDFVRLVRDSVPRTGERYLVIGAGFVGRRIIHALLLRGETKIVVMDTAAANQDAYRNDPRVGFVCGDVTKYEDVVAVVSRGFDVVYATFALVRFMDRLDHQAAASYRVNVVGTENVIKACREHGVRFLVQTSTGNVTVDKQGTSLAMTEKQPYVTRETSPHHYAWTKAIAESVTLRADGLGGMRTVAVRPCSAVFGSDDRYVLESMLKLGRTLLPPNGGSAVLDFVPVLNVVWCHLLAEKGLRDDPERVGGQAFCVSNETPMRIVDFVAVVDSVRPGGIVRVPTPERLLRLFSRVIEFAHRMGLTFPTHELSQLTACSVDFLDQSYTFKSKKARDILGYKPLYTVEQGVHLAVCEVAAGEILPMAA